MLMSRIIEVIISSKGETSIQTKGFRGDECRQASRGLEAALGIQVQERMTSEFYTSTVGTESAPEETGAGRRS
jgi:hypothetical protein